MSFFLTFNGFNAFLTLSFYVIINQTTKGKEKKEQNKKTPFF